MNIEDLGDGSDSSDEDYVPGEKEEVVSEVDSDGNLVDPSKEGENEKGKRKKLKKSRKKKNTAEKEDEQPVEEVVKEPTELTEEERKKKEEELWADFMKDTGFKSKNSKSTVVSNDQKKVEKKPSTETVVPKKVEKVVKVTQIFEFAGEEVKVEKEVDANSAEARLLSKTTPDNSKKGKRVGGGLSGISNVLGQLTKKQKISTLEKTKLDWDKFKKEENLEEELQTYNKGKDGYLERQDFLERADLRRFEIEKDLRAVERSKRLNNV